MNAKPATFAFPTDDPRYAFVTCKSCAKEWQAIDFGCAQHRLMCKGVDQDDVRHDVTQQLQAAGFNVRSIG